MEKIDQILDSLYDRVIEPMEAKQQLLDLFAVIKSLPDDYEIYQKAHEVDEKDFAQWMYECSSNDKEIIFWLWEKINQLEKRITILEERH